MEIIKQFKILDQLLRDIKIICSIIKFKYFNTNYIYILCYFMCACFTHIHFSNIFTGTKM